MLSVLVLLCASVECASVGVCKCWSVESSAGRRRVVGLGYTLPNSREGLPSSMANRREGLASSLVNISPVTVSPVGRVLHPSQLLIGRSTLTQACDTVTRPCADFFYMRTLGSLSRMSRNVTGCVMFYVTCHKWLL